MSWRNCAASGRRAARKAAPVRRRGPAPVLNQVERLYTNATNAAAQEFARAMGEKAAAERAVAEAEKKAAEDKLRRLEEEVRKLKELTGGNPPAPESK